MRTGSKRIGVLTLSIVSIVFGALVFIGFLNYVGPEDVFRTILSVPAAYLSLMIGLNILSLILYAFAWFLLVRATGHRLSFLSCQGISLTAIFTYYVTPSGLFLEATRILLSSRESKSKMRFGESAATVVMHKILFTVGFVSLTVLSMIMLVLKNPAWGKSFNKIYVILVAALVGLVGISYLASNITKLTGLSKRLVTRLDPMMQRMSKSYRNGSADYTIEDMLRKFEVAFAKMSRHRTGLLISFAVILGYWLSGVLIMYLVFRSLNYEISIWIVVLTLAVGEFIQMTPLLIPGMLGVLEAVLTAVLTSFSVPLTLAASATILLRIATFWINIPITGASATYYGAKYLIKGMMKTSLDMPTSSKIIRT